MPDLTREAIAPPARLVRWTVSVHAAVVAAQFATGTLTIAGFAEVFSGHRTNAWAVLGLGLVQAIAALSSTRARLGWFYTTLALAIPAMDGLQIWLGRHVLTPWHVTLGLLIWAASLGLLIKVWTPTWLSPPSPPTTA